MNRSIEFRLCREELFDFALLCAALNAAGVPFSVRRDAITVIITIGEGY
jgi:hypothetical protein